MAEAKATITLTLCEIEALIRMGDAAYRYYGQTNTAFDRSVIAKAKKARRSIVDQQSFRNTQRNGDFNVWDRRSD